MFKIRAIALREYLASVRTKAFLITILMMPILMGASLGIQVLFRQMQDAKEKKILVIDRTENERLAAYLIQEGEKLQALRAASPELADILGPKMTYEKATPSADTDDAKKQQRFEISQRIEKGEVEALVEIGSDILTIRKDRYVDPDKLDDRASVRLQAKVAAAGQARRTIETLLNKGIQEMRFFDQKKLRPQDIQMIQQPAIVKVKSPTQRDPKTGELVEITDNSRIVDFVLPGILIGLMFMIIMVGATPAMHTIIEEKSLRIAEVLLGSVTPFQLMAGKLLGVIGVALTMTVVYLGGGYALLSYYNLSGAVPLGIVLWFVPMLVLALLIFGSLFLAVGAAASDIKDTQTLLMPVMMIACIPFFALGPIMQEPHGLIAQVCTFFPFATPMLLVAREAAPPGVPLWEKSLAILLVLATTFVCVWAAGRIFRVGILLQGKTPSFGDLWGWIIRG